jgi:anti-sigma-K factor RskA
MSDAAHDPHWDELAAGYALHALEPDDEQAFTAHLATCAACRHELDDHSLVAAQLASLAADEAGATAPPWSRIRPALPPAVGTAPVVPRRRDDDHAVVTRLRPRHVRLLAAAAAVVGLAAVGVAGWQIGDRSSGRSSVPAAVAGCRSTDGCRVVTLLAGKAEAGDVLVRDGRARVVPTAMPALDPSHVYVLWQLPRDGAPTPVTVLGDVRTAHASAPTSLAIPYADTAAFAMSVEPANRVPTKPTQVVAVGSAT